MTDQVLMDNYLLLLKSTVEVYVHGTLESSNSDVREHLKECLDNTMSMQADTYDKMTEYGWYNIDNVDTTKIQETLIKLQSKDNSNNSDNSDNSDNEDSNVDNSDESEDTEETEDESKALSVFFCAIINLRKVVI